MENQPEDNLSVLRQRLHKLVYVKDFRHGDKILTTLRVKNRQVQTSKNGKSYLALTLADKSGEIDSRIWDEAEAVAERFQEGDIITVSGRATLYQDRLQLIVSYVAPVDFSEIDIKDYLPVSPYDSEAQYLELVSTFRGLKNEWISRLGLALLEDSEIAARYKQCPAAKTVHHAFLGGLLTHSLQLIKLIDAILPFYSHLDRDLLIFGAAFHDFGKIYELLFTNQFGYSDEGRLVGHITIGAVLIDRKIQALSGFPEALEWELKHLVLSHHGKLEYGSPKRPHTLEAEVLNLLDTLDSKIESIQSFMKAERNDNRWTALHKAYDQYYYKPDAFLRKNLDKNLRTPGDHVH